MRTARVLVLLLLCATAAAAEENILRWPKGQKVAERISDVAVWTNIGAQLVADLRAEDRKHALGMSACRWGITLGVAGLSKQFVRRTRPDGSNDRSFPSGHTMNAFANTGWSYQVSVPIALTTGYMRSAGNKHYITDTVTGALVGILAAKVCQ